MVLRPEDHGPDCTAASRPDLSKPPSAGFQRKRQRQLRFLGPLTTNVPAPRDIGP